MKKAKTSIVTGSIAFVVSQLIIFALVISAFGYGVFSKAMYKQYTNEAFRVAHAATHSVDADRLEAYRESGGNDPDYRTTSKLLDQLCNAADMTFIYIIQPDLTDYGEITFLFSAVNHNFNYTPFEVGYVRETTNEEYKLKYARLYRGETDQELLLLTSRQYDQSVHHITAMVPLKGEDGQTKGILCVQRQMEELIQARKAYIQNVLLVLLALTAIVIFSEGSFLSRRLLHPIRTITHEASRFANENVTAERRLTEEIRNKDEIGILADSIDRMEEQIVNYVENLRQVTAEKERIGAELNIARQIQASMVPNVFPPFPEKKEFEIYAAMDPAREVGGDFYDFFLVDDDHLALVIADVSGKGIPAALFMAIAKTLIKNRTLMGESPAEVLYHVNNQLCDGNEAEMFVTIWLAVVELSTGRGVAANAGHEHPAVRRKGGEYELVIYRHSLAVAAMENIRFREHSFELRPGDELFVYTDGVPEATNSCGELYGTDRMLEALNRYPDADAETLLREVTESINAFVGDAPQFDDITMLSMRYLGPADDGDAATPGNM